MIRNGDREATSLAVPPRRNPLLVERPAMETILAGVTRYPVLSDSGVFQSGEGYERVILVNSWHPDKPRHLGRLHIRVDRIPAESFAVAETWTTDGGWMPMIEFSPHDFWPEMPGYLRWAKDTSDVKTRRLSGELLTELVRLMNTGASV